MRERRKKELSVRRCFKGEPNRDGEDPTISMACEEGSNIHPSRIDRERKIEKIVHC